VEVSHASAITQFMGITYFIHRDERRLRVDKVAGLLEVGRTDDTHEIVIRHPDLKTDANGLGRIVFLPKHARHLASLLMIHAAYAEAEQAGTLPNFRMTSG
jgi:hypothetical protein